MKFILGTAQFGIDYGISNSSGKTPKKEAKHILDCALEHSISSFDTASAYGNSESLLGEIFKHRGDVEFITKVPRLEKNVVNVVNQSLNNLNTSSLFAVLLHSSDDLLSADGDRIYKDLKELQARGAIKKVGISVYSREEIDAVIEKYAIDIIQMPVNVFDQRLLQDNYLQFLKKQGVELHIRSIFLQGLLLMDIDRIPEYFKPVKAHFSDYISRIKALGLTPLQAALGFANSLPEIDGVVFGVNNLTQLKQIFCYETAHVDLNVFKTFALNDPAFVNPSLWKL